MAYCTKHARYDCSDSNCRNEETEKRDNTGQVSIAPDGDLNIGIGSNLTIDLNDGDLGVQIAPGFSLDM